MDLKTNYMGMELDNPLVAAASPLSKDLDTSKKLEDEGVSAIVAYSLFEEQITHEQQELDYFLAQGAEKLAVYLIPLAVCGFQRKRAYNVP